LASGHLTLGNLESAGQNGKYVRIDTKLISGRKLKE
jgi:hypothetical protein